MNNSSFPNPSESSPNLYQYTTPAIFENGVMSLNLVLTIQPWFMKLVQRLRSQNLTPEAVDASNLDPVRLLNILGYCSCIDSPKIPGSEEQVVEENNTAREETNRKGQKDTMSQDSQTKSVSQKDDNETTDHRKDDEFLLDIHPNEAKYFTNPRTGRKVKKLVCKVPG